VGAEKSGWQFVQSLFLFLVLISRPAFAGRPVYHEIALPDLAATSTLIVEAFPSPEKKPASCGEPLGYWRVSYVLKGDPTFKMQLLPVYPHGHHFLREAAAAGRPVPSFSAERYSAGGGFQKERKVSLLFLRQESGCWELAADGAQEVHENFESVRALANPTDCRLQEDAIRVLLHRLPQDCLVSEDCKVLQLHPRKCERPLALNKNAESRLPAEWAVVTAHFRESCENKIGREPNCNADPRDAHCSQGRCQFGLAPPQALAFSEAKLQESCAPSDGPSMDITLGTAGAEYPRLGINWWSPSRPERKAGTYTLETLLGGKASEGFSASYCAREGSCVLINRLWLRVIIKESGNGELELDGNSMDGSPLKAKVPLHLLPKPDRMFCG
jgi:hypothetical protein